jgi:hypothetical protein
VAMATVVIGASILQRIADFEAARPHSRASKRLTCAACQVPARWRPTPPRRNCSFYFSWCDQLEMGLCHGNQRSPECDCS